MISKACLKPDCSTTTQKPALQQTMFDSKKSENLKKKYKPVCDGNFIFRPTDKN